MPTISIQSIFAVSLTTLVEVWSLLTMSVLTHANYVHALASKKKLTELDYGIEKLYYGYVIFAQPDIDPEN